MELIEAIRAGRGEPPSGIRTLGLDETHRWLDFVEPGHVQFTWAVDDAHRNLEGAVICSWIVALADQAVFLATQTLCADGEGTRMAALELKAVRNVSDGRLSFEARVEARTADRFYCTCRVSSDSEDLAALVTAEVDII
jgi:acyl-coenzyme A thioesterase PaaI-like protein